MPYAWSEPPEAKPQQLHLRLWPHRSLMRRGFVWFIGLTALMTLFPLMAVLGSSILWVLLPFCLVMLGSIWGALHVSNRRGDVLEILELSADHARLTRQNPDGSVQEWDANRYWVDAHLHLNSGPVENYITLRGGDREVEIGRFLDHKERLALYGELKTAFSK